MRQIALTVALLLAFAGGATAQTRAPTATPTPTAEEAAAEKTRAEIDKLQAEEQKIRSDNGFWGRAPAYGAVLAGFAALLGLLLTLRAQITERRRQREEDAKQATKDREEREAALLKRFDEQFTQMVAHLTSSDAGARAGAAASIRTFLKPEHAAFHQQVFDLLLANLKFPRGDATDRVISRAFARALRDLEATLPQLVGDDLLDLSDANLERVDLSGLRLPRCELEQANLERANLTGTCLWRARGKKVNLRGALLVRAELGEARLREADLVGARLGDATLVSAKLQDAEARKASFDGARLQDAHLEGADLRGASFRGANLNTAYLTGASFDDAALLTILESDHWEKARFDAPVLQRLRELSTA